MTQNLEFEARISFSVLEKIYILKFDSKQSILYIGPTYYISPPIRNFKNFGRGARSFESMKLGRHPKYGMKHCPKNGCHLYVFDKF